MLATALCFALGVMGAMIWPFGFYWIFMAGCIPLSLMWTGSTRKLLLVVFPVLSLLIGVGSQYYFTDNFMQYEVLRKNCWVRALDICQ